MSVPTEGHCPTCRTTALLNRRGQCVWCDTYVTTKPATRSERGHNANRGIPVLMTDEVLERAQVMHREGKSLRSCAEELLPETDYSSAKSLTMAFSRHFRHRGWYVRDRAEATVAAHLKHGRMRRNDRDSALVREQKIARGEIRDVMCKGVKRLAPGAGQPCKNHARAGSEWCRFHDPALAEERAAHWERVAPVFRAYRYGRKVA